MHGQKLNAQRISVVRFDSFLWVLNMAMMFLYE
jgi:hypothetical protein